MDKEPANAKYTDIVGRGYNGWEYYANPLSLRLPLFDLSPAAKPEVDYIEPRVSDTFAIVGEDLRTYTLNMAASIGVGPVTSFIKSLTVSFGADSLTKSSSKFGTLNRRIAYGRAELIHAPLLPAAARDLESMDPVQLFDTYGTHYIRSAVLGGRLSFSSSFDSNETTTNVSAKVICDIGEKYLKAGHVEFGPSKDEDYKKNLLARATLSTVGGDPSLPELTLGELKDGGIGSVKAEAWTKSIENHQQIADFGTNGLVPVYELIQKAGRRDEVRQAWVSYLQRMSTLSTPTGPGEFLRYGAPFYLKADGNKFLSASERMDSAVWTALGWSPPMAIFADPYEYYPTIREASPTRLKLAKPDDTDAGKVAVQGEFVNMLTSEDLTGTLGHVGPTYNRLGAWGDDWFVYYYRQGKTGPYDEEQWSIQRVDDSSGNELRYGDRVQLISKKFPNQKLCPGGPSKRSKGFTFLTTKLSPAGAWTIAKP